MTTYLDFHVLLPLPLDISMNLITKVLPCNCSIWIHSHHAPSLQENMSSRCNIPVAQPTQSHTGEELLPAIEMVVGPRCGWCHLRKNWIMKWGHLGISMILWVVTMNTQTRKRQVDQPLTYMEVTPTCMTMKKWSSLNFATTMFFFFLSFLIQSHSIMTYDLYVWYDISTMFLYFSIPLLNFMVTWYFNINNYLG